MGKAIIFQYFVWHFKDTPKELLKAWKNYLRFYLEYFSLPALLKTYFSHWHRYRFSYGKGFNPALWAEAFVGNMMSRIVGMILKTFILVFGIIFEVFVFFAGLIMIFAWFLLPIILLAGFFISLDLLF